MVTNTALGEAATLLVEDVSKRFGADWALVRASFSLSRGTMALLTGPNGSGKTTLIRCLSTALVPDFGRASVAGIDLVQGRDQVRQRVAVLNQPPGFYGGLSARENLTLLQDVLGLGEAGPVDALLDRVGLRGKLNVPLDAFSSGMKQRFALAKLALVQRDLLLLDEPETHLDADGLSLLQELMADWKARGAAILCATHAPERFGSLCDLEIRLSGAGPETREGK